MLCPNCAQHFHGAHAYTRHLAACNGNDRQCPRCRVWFMTRAQRDAHAATQHGGAK